MLLAAILAFVLLAASCGDDGPDALDDADADDADSDAGADAVEDAAGAGPVDDDEPFSSPEALAAILGTDFGRQLFAEGMAEDGAITVDQALCLAEKLDIELLVSLAFDGPEPVGDVVAVLFQVLGDCGLDPGVFLSSA